METRQDYLCRHDIDHAWNCDEKKNLAVCTNCKREMILDTSKPVMDCTNKLVKIFKIMRLLKW